MDIRENQTRRDLIKVSLAVVTLSIFLVLPASAQTVIGLQTMDFGGILGVRGGGTVALAPDGTKTVTGSLRDNGGTPRPARFRITGTPNTPVTVTVTTAQNPANGSDSMSFTPYLPSSGTTDVVLLDPSGVAEVNVGGTLSIPSISIMKGSYSGGLNLSAQY